MALGYFDAKKELKNICRLGYKAINKKDSHYINFLLSNLDQLENALKDKFVINAFGTHILIKDINYMRFFLIDGLKKKKAKDVYNERKNTKNT